MISSIQTCDAFCDRTTRAPVEEAATVAAGADAAGANAAGATAAVAATAAASRKNFYVFIHTCIHTRYCCCTRRQMYWFFSRPLKPNGLLRCEYGTVRIVPGFYRTAPHSTYTESAPWFGSTP